MLYKISIAYRKKYTVVSFKMYPQGGKMRRESFFVVVSYVSTEILDVYFCVFMYKMSIG